MLEVLIAAGLTSLVAVGALAFYDSAQRLYVQAVRATSTSQDASTAIEHLRRNLLNAQEVRTPVVAGTPDLHQLLITYYPDPMDAGVTATMLYRQEQPAPGTVQLVWHPRWDPVLGADAAPPEILAASARDFRATDLAGQPLTAASVTVVASLTVQTPGEARDPFALVMTVNLRGRHID